ncbi:hypothetical protein [Hamadaea tsunoensis]|uniref:hypothetical protein n=1 Tax=Hamadaea tsunoensis TaxID=53368 RepID=UPI000424CE8E|nr:hypothetical protein [Hamadaea tsunoensis]
MIWLTWRQFRTQSLVALGSLAALAGYLVLLALQSRHAYATDIVNCVPAECASARRAFAESFGGQFTVLGGLLVVVPGLIGIFWGAPLIARELEEKTDRLVWNQSVPRTRWLAVKLGLLTVAAAAVAGVFSLLLTWSASRYDLVMGERFGVLNFAARNLVPAGYAAFAFVLGAVAGLLVRRTLPAMAITLAVFAAAQILMPSLVRAHLMPPVSATVTFTEDTMARSDLMGVSDTRAWIDGYTMPGAWSLSSRSQIFNADGSAFTAQQAHQCDGNGPQETMACTARLNLHFGYTYQPADRYWRFQWIELALFGGLTVLLAGVGFWAIRRYSG